MKLSGPRLNLFDLRLLLLWAVPVSIFVVRNFDPILPYQPAPLARGVFGFPLAYGAWSGASSGENIISVIPLTIDLLVAGIALYALGLGLRRLSPSLALAAALGLGILAWLLVPLSFLIFDTWALNWWTLGSPDYFIG